MPQARCASMRKGVARAARSPPLGFGHWSLVIPLEFRDMAWHGLIHQYREFLPVSETTPIVTLNEGNTPLIRADRLGRHLGLPCEVYLKYEGANPTGDRKSVVEGKRV